MLLAEFAVDPDTIADWKALALIEARFGFHNGAVIPEFPKTWLRDLSQKARKELYGSAQYSKVEERLRDLKQGYLVGSGRPYLGDKSWFENARAQRDGKPFHRIVTPHEADADDVCDIWGLSDSDFDDLHDTQIQKKAKSYSEATCLLLANSKSIKFVDPYFSGRRGYQKGLRCLLEAAGMGKRRNFAKVEVHTSDLAVEKGKPFDLEHEKSLVRQNIPPLLTAGFEVIFYWWKDSGKKEVHPRYLMTERAGIRFDRGFNIPSELDAQEGVTDVTMMKPQKLNTEWNRYRPEATVFQSLDNFRVVGTAQE
ncbi:hypothetical protein FV139_12340 [Parahaliea maris]|uniref:Uncharacterized protein n=1 Tax=Parahaliea maris TaxID=2716870 RepID=A0A5C8ZWF0_9GAMM|nr:hypothetical protein [Parahaliea maris]TXS92758.1 hypothetical protein FV139_12340 [Parahaliea maris]